ncbi:MAG: globin [Pseudomonadota bacterium]
MSRFANWLTQEMTLNNPIFEDSYGRLFGPDVASSKSSQVFFEVFYENFLKNDNVRVLFRNTDMSTQVQMLKRSLFQLVTFYVTGRPSPELERIAKIHCGLAIQPEMFDLWLEALIDTVRTCDIQANETTEMAWCWALAPGITYMRMRLLDRQAA